MHRLRLCGRVGLNQELGHQGDIQQLHRGGKGGPEHQGDIQQLHMGGEGEVRRGKMQQLHNGGNEGGTRRGGWTSGRHTAAAQGEREGQGGRLEIRIVLQLHRAR